MRKLSHFLLATVLVIATICTAAPADANAKPKPRPTPKHAVTKVVAPVPAAQPIKIMPTVSVAMSMVNFAHQSFTLGVTASQNANGTCFVDDFANSAAEGAGGSTWQFGPIQVKNGFGSIKQNWNEKAHGSVWPHHLIVDCLFGADDVKAKYDFNTPPGV